MRTASRIRHAAANMNLPAGSISGSHARGSTAVRYGSSAASYCSLVVYTLPSMWPKSLKPWPNGAQFPGWGWSPPPPLLSTRVSTHARLCAAQRCARSSSGGHKAKTGNKPTLSAMPQMLRARSNACPPGVARCESQRREGDHICCSRRCNLGRPRTSLHWPTTRASRARMPCGVEKRCSKRSSMAMMVACCMRWHVSMMRSESASSVRAASLAMSMHCGTRSATMCTVCNGLAVNAVASAALRPSGSLQRSVMSISKSAMHTNIPMRAASSMMLSSRSVAAHVSCCLPKSTGRRPRMKVFRAAAKAGSNASSRLMMASRRARRSGKRELISTARCKWVLSSQAISLASSGAAASRTSKHSTLPPTMAQAMGRPVFKPLARASSGSRASSFSTM
mmetsp:Transcript_135701/g.378012  ORF Transcript_135701/g.378012 Transcript_135701/m.378012 type:complete len:394 (-) Transcript_135701:631-1812(-)